MNKAYFMATDSGLKLTEANIQAEFYHQCRLLELNCLVEFVTPVGRLDAVIMDERCESIFAIVECKNCRPWNRASRQFQKYGKIGAAIFELFLMKECAPLALKISTMIPELKGVAVCDILHMDRIKRGRRAKLPPEWDESLIIRELSGFHGTHLSTVHVKTIPSFQP